MSFATYAEHSKECPDDWRVRNFAETFKTVAIPNGAKRQDVYYEVFQDGFVLVTMGYTGKNAMSFKIAYISKFNEMRDQLAAEERALTSGDVKPQSTSNPCELTPSTPADRAPLRSMVNAWSKVSGQHHDALWPQVRSAFNLSRIDQLPAEWVPDAIAWVQEKIDGAQRAIPAAPSAPVVSYAPPARPVLSTELQRYAEDFDRLCGPVAEMERVLTQVMRLSYPLVRETTLSMCGDRLAAAEQQVARGHLEAALEEHLEHSRRMVHDIITCGRLGINVVRDLARVQGR